jgi:hypothetical protein
MRRAIIIGQNQPVSPTGLPNWPAETEPATSTGPPPPRDRQSVHESSGPYLPPH